MSSTDLILFSNGLAGGTNNSFATDDAYVIESSGGFDAVVGTLAGFLPISFPGKIFQTGFTVNWNFSGEKNDDVGGVVSLQPTDAEVDGGGFGDLTIPESQGACKWTTTNRVDCGGWAFLPGQGTGGSDRTVEVWFNFTANPADTTITDPTSTDVRRRNHTYNGNNDGWVTALAAPDLPQETWSVRISDDDGTLGTCTHLAPPRNCGWRLAVRDTSTDLLISKFEGIRYEQFDAQDPDFDLPPWFAQNNWQYFVHVVISGAHAPELLVPLTSTGDGSCTVAGPPEDACLTVQYNTVTVVPDAKAIVIGSGPELSVVLGQDRAASPAVLSDYFEVPNIDGDLVLGRAVRNSFETNSTFNDRIRAVPQ